MSLLLDNLVTILERQILLGENRTRISPAILAEFMKDFPNRNTHNINPENVKLSSTTQILPPASVIKTMVAKPEIIVNESDLFTVSNPALLTKSQEVNSLNLEQLRHRGNRCSACNFSLGEARSKKIGLSEKPRLLVITEPSGRTDEQMVDPFHGEAGELFLSMLNAMKLDLNEVYITMAHKCFGPNAREKMVETKPYLQRQIELLKPQLLLVFGSAALTILLGEQSVMNVRGRWLSFQGIPLLATYPAPYLLKKVEAKREAWTDLKQVIAKLSL